MKIFGDGQRGVREDDPGEMSVELGDGSGTKRSGSGNHETLEEKCKTLKKQGNDFVEKKRYYAASEAYLAVFDAMKLYQLYYLLIEVGL